MCVRVVFEVVLPCAGCGAAWNVEVTADVTVRDAAAGNVAVADRGVWGILKSRSSREADCGCEHAPRDAHGLMASRNSHEIGDEVEELYFAAALAAVHQQQGAALRPAA